MDQTSELILEVIGKQSQEGHWGSGGYLRSPKFSHNLPVRVLDIIVGGAIGKHHLKKGDKAHDNHDAYRAYQKAIESSYSNAVKNLAYFRRANLHFELIDGLDEAIADYTMAIRCKTDDPWSYLNRGYTYSTYKHVFDADRRKEMDSPVTTLPMTYRAARADLNTALDLFIKMKTVARERYPSNQELQTKLDEMIDKTNDYMRELREMAVVTIREPGTSEAIIECQEDRQKQAEYYKNLIATRDPNNPEFPEYKKREKANSIILDALTKMINGQDNTASQIDELRGNVEEILGLDIHTGGHFITKYPQDLLMARTIQVLYNQLS